MEKSILHTRVPCNKLSVFLKIRNKHTRCVKGQSISSENFTILPLCIELTPARKMGSAIGTLCHAPHCCGTYNTLFLTYHHSGSYAGKATSASLSFLYGTSISPLSVQTVIHCHPDASTRPQRTEAAPATPHVSVSSSASPIIGPLELGPSPAAPKFSPSSSAPLPSPPR